MYVAAAILVVTSWAASLTPHLDSPRWRTREAASVALRPLVPLIRLHLEDAALEDSEGGRRSRWLLDHIPDPAADRRWLAHLQCADWHLPWLHPAGAPDMDGWLSLAGGGGYFDDDWRGYREATRLWLIDAIAAGRPWQAALQSLWREELRWRCRCQPWWFAWRVTR